MAFEVQQKQQTHVVCGGGTRNHSPISGGGGGGGFAAFDSNSNHLHRPIPITLDLFHSELSSSRVELDEPSPLPLGWQKFLNLKTGEIYYSKDKQLVCDTTMSRNGKGPKLDLKLNLSPPRVNPQVDSPKQSATSSPTSPPSSCVSSELNNNNNNNNDDIIRYSNSPEATSMMLVGCPRCLMYVMLSEEEPKCPKCKSTVLLDFLHDNNNTKKTRKN